MPSSIVVIAYIITICLGATEADNQGFPKILWVFWEQGYDKAPSFTQLCIKNKEKYAANSGWELRFLTKQNLHQYINESAIDQMLEKAEDKMVQLRADILRMMLLYQYGGMWMDANSLFLKPLSWVDQISQDKRVYNKIQKSPQIFISAYTKYSHGGNITYHFDQRLNQVVNVFPGLENWFILAKPKSLFLKDALQTLRAILKEKKQQMDKKILNQGLLLSKEHLDPYLIGSDYTFQILLQRKQKQIEKSNKDVKYAVQHYGIWHFEADESVYKFTVYQRFKRYQMWADLITFSVEDLHDVFHEGPNFLKFVGWQHPEFSLFLSNYASFNCWEGDSMIQKDSVVYKYLIQGFNNSMANKLFSLQSSINDRNFCKTKVDSDIDNSNHQTFIKSVIQSLLAILLIGLMVFISLIHRFFQHSIKFQEIPQYQG